MARVRRNLRVSERRACRILSQPRMTQRYQPAPNGDEGRLLQRMLSLVGRQPRYGYRRITALLRREGWTVNRKRVFRLWRREGLKVPQKTRKKQRLGSSVNAAFGIGRSESITCGPGISSSIRRPTGVR